jgi:Immunity protein 50
MEHGKIVGAEKLVGVFGYWPSFHDAEVLSMQLDRKPLNEANYGPTVQALVHTFEITNEVSPDGYLILRHNVLVRLIFHEVAELQVKDFNHQNALMGLSLLDLSYRQLERVKWGVQFDRSFGANASFQCYSVEVSSVVPCGKDGAAHDSDVSDGS